MKKSIAALALACVAYVASAQAGDVGVSISIGQPGFYGQIDIGGYGAPQVLYRQPVIVEQRYWNPAPVYVRVPPYQYGNWHQYCGRYNACARPVYFVRDDWYRDVYAPRYYRNGGRYDNRDHGRNGRGSYDHRLDDRRDRDRGHH
jgi:hypothetical protein